MVIHVHWLLIPLLLILAALFAAAEASLFSLSRSQLESMREDSPDVYRIIRGLIYRPDALLSTIIIGNECLNILIGTLIVTMLQTYFVDMSDRIIAICAVLISSFLLLTFSEILPKILAFRIPVEIASVLAYPTSWVHWLFQPIRTVFLTISGGIIKLFGIEPHPPSVVSEKDFLTLVEVGAESGSLDRDEKEMIFNVFNFSDLPVSAVMTPWAKVFSIPDNFTIEEVLAQVRKRAFSRVPIVSGSERRVVGVLYTKALLKLLLRPDVMKAPRGDAVPEEALRNAIFPPYIVSTHKKVSRLFREFKLKKVHIALVVDEYGRHLGVVTLEDVLNALFQTQKKIEGAKK